MICEICYTSTTVYIQGHTGSYCFHCLPIIIEETKKVKKNLEEEKNQLRELRLRNQITEGILLLENS